MGIEINLLKNYPKTVRKLSFRNKNKNKKVINLASKFGKEYFDGSRLYGYGGYYYNPRYWKKVVKDFKRFYKLKTTCKVLDVGCAKGFMLYDFKQLIPKSYLRGIDISSYAINNAKTEIKKFVKIGNAKKLPFQDSFFDLVISINTLHNLKKKDCITALSEIKRVTKKNAFITLDAYKNNKQKQRMKMWNLQAKSIFHVNKWKEIFDLAGYKGDYYWFIP
jgi:ubiquinone/menaquinone biosynthesis C-methylase UbiE